jgi:WD40 repeat protein
MDATLVSIGNSGAQKSFADVVFVHGLDGDPTETWRNKETGFFWPAVLSEQNPGVCVWSLGYPCASSRWIGQPMPLADRAMNALALLEVRLEARRPLVFITHSMGGLLVKQLLRHAIEFGSQEWRSIAERTKGVVFLSTPNSGSSLATFIQYLHFFRPTVAINDLSDADARLRELNIWFRNSVGKLALDVVVFYEKHKVGPALVVDDASADPGIVGVMPIPVDANHIEICKPKSLDELVYLRVQKFILRHCVPTGPSAPWVSRSKRQQPSGPNSSMRVLAISLRKPNEVNAVAWSPSGNYIASGSEDSKLRIWSVGTGRVTLEKLAHTAPIRTVAWSPSEAQIACGSSDRTISIWAFPSGRIISRIEGFGDWVRGIAWAPGGETLAAGSADGKVALWSLLSNRFLREWYGHKDIVRAVCWSPDGRRLTSCSKDGSVRFWEPGSNERLASVEVGGGAVLTVAWSPNGRLVAFGTGNGDVGIIDPNTYTVLKTVRLHNDSVLTASWAPNGKYLATGSADRQVIVVDVPAMHAKRGVGGGCEGSIRSISWCPKSQSLASGSTDQSLVIWNARRGGQTARWFANDYWYRCASVSPDLHHAVVGFANRSASVVSLITGNVVWTKAGSIPLGSAATSKESRAKEKRRERIEEHSRCVAWAPNGEFVAVGADDRTVRLIDAASGDCCKLLDCHRDSVKVLAWSSDSRYLASSAEGRFAVWNVENDETSVHDLPTGRVVCLSWSPSGKQLCVSTDDGSMFEHTTDGRRVLTRLGTAPSVSVYSANGKYIWIGDEAGTVHRIDCLYGSETNCWSLDGRVQCVTELGEGRAALAVSDSGTLWSLSTEPPTATVKSHLVPSSHTCVYLTTVRDSQLRFRSEAAELSISVFSDTGALGAET